MLRSIFAPTWRRCNSTLAQLTQAIKSCDAAPATATNKSVVSDVDHLLMNDWLAGTQGHMRAKSDDYLLQQTLRHPREVAKSMRVFGPLAGRTVDVRHGNLGQTIGLVKSILRSNKVILLKRSQARHTRTAKYQKQKHRDWWRRNFSLGFRDLMAQVRDAKRRGY